MAQLGQTVTKLWGFKTLKSDKNVYTRDFLKTRFSNYNANTGLFFDQKRVTFAMFKNSEKRGVIIKMHEIFTVAYPTIGPVGPDSNQTLGFLGVFGGHMQVYKKSMNRKTGVLNRYLIYLLFAYPTIGPVGPDSNQTLGFLGYFHGCLSDNWPSWARQ